jgi:hypothetical protein
VTDSAYAALLDALTRDRLEEEEHEAERLATSRRSLGDVQEDLERVERAELAEARHDAGAFRAALDDARARGGPDGAAEVPYDSRDPVDNMRVDLLIQNLVRPGYAEVRTEEPEPNRYVYHLRVDWSALRDLSLKLGHPLPF